MQHVWLAIMKRKRHTEVGQGAGMRVGDLLGAVTLSRVVREITLHRPEEDRGAGHVAI